MFLNTFLKIWYLYTRVHSIIHNTQNVKAIQVSIDS